MVAVWLCCEMWAAAGACDGSLADGTHLPQRSVLRLPFRQAFVRPLPFIATQKRKTAKLEERVAELERTLAETKEALAAELKQTEDLRDKLGKVRAAVVLCWCLPVRCTKRVCWLRFLRGRDRVVAALFAASFHWIVGFL